MFRRASQILETVPLASSARSDRLPLPGKPVGRDTEGGASSLDLETAGAESLDTRSLPGILIPSAATPEPSSSPLSPLLNLPEPPPQIEPARSLGDFRCSPAVGPVHPF